MRPPSALTVVGFARRDKTDEVFRKELEEASPQVLAPERPG